MPSFRSHVMKALLKVVVRRNATLSFEESRIAMNRSVSHFKTAKGVKSERVSVAGRPAEWLIPEGADSSAAVLFLHGGAYTQGSLDSHRAMVSHIAKSGHIRVLQLDYRLAPESPFPAAVDDATAAFEWIQQALNLTADRIVIAGDSAGGGLTLATALHLRDSGKALPAGLVCLSPWTDLTLKGESVERLRHRDPIFSSTDRLRASAAAYCGQT
ncbi:TPA: alpha/beta hydrolase, partial [Pseudomonas aeruginosa]